MSTNKQLQKIEFIIESIINKYYAIDQQLALLSPLLDDEELFTSWDNTLGVHGVEALRMSIYLSILSDVRALLLDPDPKTASLKNVAAVFSNPNYVAALRKKFCLPTGVQVAGHNEDEEMRKFVEEQFQAAQIEEAEAIFDKLAPSIPERFESLEQSKRAKRINLARNQMISHRQLKTTDGERELYNPAHFGLTWGDAQEIVTSVKELIFDANLLINNSSYEDERYKGHREIAASFWGRVKNT